VRFPGGHDYPSDSQRGDSSATQLLDEARRRQLTQGPFGVVRRSAQQRSVLRHHPVEEIEPGENLLEILEPATGHQDETTSRCAQAFQRRQGGGFHPATSGDAYLQPYVPGITTLGQLTVSGHVRSVTAPQGAAGDCVST
jgi:hypothetical protein